VNRKLVLYISLFIALIVLLIITYTIVSNKINEKSFYKMKPIEYTNETEEPIYGEPIHGKPRDSFVKNQVLIMFDEKASKEEVESSLEKIKYVTKKESLFDYSYSLTLSITFNNLGELNNYCKEIQKDKLITVCEPNHIIYLDDCSKGPC